MGIRGLGFRICTGRQCVLRKRFLNARQGIRDVSRLLLEFRRETRQNLRRRRRECSPLGKEKLQ